MTRQAAESAKVFWFFFSKKNCFLPLLSNGPQRFVMQLSRLVNQPMR
jgi:hypothetical protein